MLYGFRIRRPFCIVLIAAFLSAAFPVQSAQAVTTAREVEAGQSEDKQITQQYTTFNDPLLNQWVNGVGAKLWNQTARKDVPYNTKILQADDINAFSTLGGYIYLNSGTLDFVQSDDELAGVIGHETGHIERRHAVTFPAKAQALDLLLGVASLFVPLLYNVGQLGEAGILAKASRSQELQADQYGLLLMSRAGYDPDAMISFMNHLGAAHAENNSAVDKYLADHPGFPNRVAHLVGYAELDPKKRTNDQILVQALHDQQTARYNIAAAKFQQLLKSDPDNGYILLHLGETQVALGLPNKAEQTLALASAKGSAGTRKQAMREEANLSASMARFSFPRVNIPFLLGKINDSTAKQTSTAAELAQRRDPGKDQLRAVETRIQNISYDIPNLSHMGTRANTRGGTILRNAAAMIRSLNIAHDNAKQVINGVGGLEKNKESGLIRENAAILNEMQYPLKLATIPERSRSVLPSYPAMLADLDRAQEDMIRAVDASRSALALLDTGLSDLDDVLRRLRQIRTDYNGSIPDPDYTMLLPLMTKANASLNKAAVAGSQAWQLYNLSHARRLQTRITLLGLTFPQTRYTTLQYALQQRLKSNGVDYLTMLHAGLTPGEAAAASVIAADTNASPLDVIRQAKIADQSIIDLTNTRNMSAFSLEIFLHLIYLDYTDDPNKEAHDMPNAAPTIAPLNILERARMSGLAERAITP